MKFTVSLFGHFQINYRPPSNMGIAIPLTDHFYHADPSKPIPRNLFYKSKVNIFSAGKLVFILIQELIQ